MFSAHHWIMLSICTKFHVNIFASFNVTEGTRSPYKSEYNCRLKITQRHSSMRNVGGDMVLVLCTLSDDGFIHVPKFVNMSSTVLKFRAKTISIL